MIAIIIPVYNGEQTIMRSVKSLLKQSFENWTCIIINDGSSDQTRNILHDLQNDSRFIIINFKENIGRGAARNVGLKKVKEIQATYMCMLDADDLYDDNKLYEQYYFMEKNPRITLLSNALGVVKKGELLSVTKTSSEFENYYYDNFLKYVAIPHASSIIRVKDIDVEFDSSMRVAEDHDFLIRLLKDKYYAFSPQILYYYFREESYSYSKQKETLDATLRRYKKLKVSKAFRFKIYTLNVLKKILFYFLIKFNLYSYYISLTSSAVSEQEKLKFNLNYRNESTSSN